MSGVEVVGLTLAILPLLVSAAEHYDHCIRPILRYRKLAVQVQAFQRKLDVQKAIFTNQCRLLLESVVDHDEAARMLAARSSDPAWQNANLENELLGRLGDAKDACVTSIELVTEQLDAIQNESQVLRDLVDRDKEVKHRMLKKLRVCLSESPLEKHIKTLRGLNDDFIKLSAQASFTNGMVSRGSHRAPTWAYDIRFTAYKNVREASARVYEALVRACTKHSEHIALFCVEPVNDSIQENGSDRVKFRIAFSRIPLNKAADEARIPEQDEPIWFVIDTYKNEETATFSVGQVKSRYVAYAEFPVSSTNSGQNVPDFNLLL